MADEPAHERPPDRPPRLLLLALVTLSLGCLAAWGTRDAYRLNGDEPHYLALMTAISEHRTLELTAVYENDFPRLDPHTVPGVHGQFSRHGIGLAVLLLGPFLVGGPAGVRVASTLVVVPFALLTWLFAGSFGMTRRRRMLATALASLTVPVVAGATQVYPDLPAGVAALAGLAWFERVRRPRTVWTDAAGALAVALLPWLHFKLSVPALVLTGAVVVRMRRQGERDRIGVVAGLVGVSLALQVAYNLYAFGNPAGPIVRSLSEVSRTSAMVLTGLILDQRHGLLLLQPVLWITILFLPLFVRRRPALASLSLLMTAMLLVPNAMHINWFGGYSFAGRFGWSALCTLVVPMTFALAELDRRSSRTLTVCGSALLGLQCVLLGRAMFAGVGQELYNAPATTPVERYPFLFGPIGRVLPALYRLDEAVHRPVNYLWAGLAAGLLVAGIRLAARAENVGRTSTDCR